MRQAWGLGLGLGSRGGNRGPWRSLGLESNTQETEHGGKGLLPKVFQKLKQNHTSLKACFHYLKSKASLGN